MNDKNYWEMSKQYWSDGYRWDAFLTFSWGYILWWLVTFIVGFALIPTTLPLTASVAITTVISWVVIAERFGGAAKEFNEWVAGALVEIVLFPLRLVYGVVSFVVGAIIVVSIFVSAMFLAFALSMFVTGLFLFIPLALLCLLGMSVKTAVAIWVVVAALYAILGN